MAGPLFVRHNGVGWVFNYFRRSGRSAALPVWRQSSPEPKQVGCDNVVVAKDGRTVAWTALMDNCCTSYPIPLSVIVMKNGKSKVFNHVQMVWKWRFVDDGKHLAVLWGPAHGWPSAATLYVSRSGKQL